MLGFQNSLCDPWILPIIQGYIQIEDCRVDVGHFLDDEDKGKQYEIFTLCILSRRSRFRAGTRYKRRGVDEDGEVANYVESEQIIMYQSHEVSFLQVRGSVPVFWSQPGYKYRPPPRLDKGQAYTLFVKSIIISILTQVKMKIAWPLRSILLKKLKNMDRSVLLTW